MFHCRDTVQEASTYIDGEMGFSRRLGLRTHLLLCVHCRRFLAQFQLASATAAHEAKQAASEQDVSAVLEKIEN